jgi:hypothetical protein
MGLLGLGRGGRAASADRPHRLIGDDQSRQLSRRELIQASFKLSLQHPVGLLGLALLTLVAWTANVQGWTITHSMFEYSSKMQIIETFMPSADGQVITVGATFYDPEAFIRPVHTVTPWEFRTGLDDPEARFTFDAQGRLHGGDRPGVLDREQGELKRAGLETKIRNTGIGGNCIQDSEKYGTY